MAQCSTKPQKMDCQWAQSRALHGKTGDNLSAMVRACLPGAQRLEARGRIGWADTSFNASQLLSLSQAGSEKMPCVQQA